jgi:hypothetical protein
MAWRSYKRDINKIHTRIDKMAKKGRDNFQEYYNYVDSMILKKQYGLLTQVLLIKYDFNWDKYFSAAIVKQRSWSAILFKTNTVFQDGKYNLMKSLDVYQIGLTYYREVPQTIALVVDGPGSGAYLDPIVENGGVTRIDVLRTGQNYSTASTINIIGGLTAATAVIPLPNGVRGGMIIKVNVTATGSSHNIDIELGNISENDYYINTPPSGLPDMEFQEMSGNKRAYLSVLKVGTTSTATFSDWGTQSSYDKNLLELYTQALDYLI